MIPFLPSLSHHFRYRHFSPVIVSMRVRALSARVYPTCMFSRAIAKSIGLTYAWILLFGHFWLAGLCVLRWLIPLAMVKLARIHTHTAPHKCASDKSRHWGRVGQAFSGENCLPFIPWVCRQFFSLHLLFPLITRLHMSSWKSIYAKADTRQQNTFDILVNVFDSEASRIRNYF